MNFVTLAVLPFENLSGHPEDACLATGFLHDLLAELTRFPALGVIGPDSVRTGAERSVDGGAEYFLKGSVRRNGTTLRMAAQLVEAATGRHLWGGRYDGGRLLEAPDEIAARVANALAVRIDQSLLVGTRRRHPTTLEAYECWLRGMECLQRGTAEADAEGRQFFERALASDPHYARALGGLSLSHFNEWSCQTWNRWEEKERLAYDFARRAETLDPDDPAVQMILARIEQYRRAFDHAAPRLHRVLQLAPNDAGILIQLASCFTMDGNPELGLELATRSLALNPLCPAWHYCFAALPLFALRRYEEFLEVGKKSPAGLVVDVPAYKAAACAFLGDHRRAAAYLEEFRGDFRARILCGNDSRPGELFRWILHVNPFRRDEDLAHLAEGLRLAGLEEARAVEIVEWPIANVFRREGAVWTISFDHQVAQMPELRGFLDIAQLLAQPGREISATVLAGGGVHETGLRVADETALRAYRARLAEIDEEIAQAGDEGHAEALESEREEILKEIRRATGLGGRVRQSGGAAEKARTAVTWRIRSAIRRIAGVHSALGRHFENAVRTGAFCSYQPERLVEWRL